VNVEPREPEQNMDAHPADEVRQLWRCVNDLANIVALPAIWVAGTRSEMVRTLNDVPAELPKET
jgi:hypothetical protein